MNKKLMTIAAGLGALLASASAQATVIFTPGNNPQQPGEENILFATQTTGATVTGRTNQSNVDVTFSSTTDTLTETASGQANVTALDQLINNITIAVPGHVFGDLIINPFLGGGNQQTSPTATVSVVANDGTFTRNLTLGNGNNFLTITTADGETISSVTISSAAGFQDLRQPRISEISGTTPPTSVPEPASLALLGVALASLGTLRRQRRD